MKNLIDVIDVEILYNYLPDGDYFVQVNDDSFDEDLFDYFNLENKEDFIEILATYNNPKEPYCIQGTVLFINKNTIDIIDTNNTVVKLCQDVTLLTKGNSIENIYSPKIKYIENF